MPLSSTALRSVLRRTGLRALCALVLFAAATAFAQAEDNPEGQVLQTKISQVGVWDTNPLMLTHDAKTIYGSTTSPSLSYSDRSPTHMIAATGSLDINRFTKSSFDSDDAHGTLSLLKMNQRWQAGIDGTADRDTTRTSDVTNFGLNLGTVEHTAYSVSPNVAFSPTALDKLSLAARFEKDIYDSDAYVDYSVASLTPEYARRLTPQTSALFSAQVQRYQSGGTYKNRLDSISPMIGFETDVNQTLRFNVQGGMQASQGQSAFLQNRHWNWDYIFSGSATYKGQANGLSLSATRARQSYGNGYESLLTSFTLDNRHDITKRLSFKAGGGYQFSDPSQENGTNMDSILNGKTGLIYRVTEELDLNVDYQYRRERFVHIDQTAEENVAKLGLTLRPGDL